MNLNEICHMIGLIDDEILQGTVYIKEKKKVKYKNLIIAACVCLFIGISIGLIPMVMNHSESLFESGNTLPGATELNPAVMYNGVIYYWKGMSGSVKQLPQGILPEGYEYVGDIKYNSDEKLTEDLQFIAKFKATGQLYYNKKDPDNVYICITTDWLDNAYVIFSKQ